MIKKLILVAVLLVVAAPVRAETKIVALGASNVAGWRVARDDAFPSRLEAMLRKAGHDVRVVNAGVSWDTSKMMLDRLDRDVPQGTAIVVLAENVRQVTNASMPQIEKRLRDRHIAVLRVNFGNVPRNLLQADGIHMTAQGHAYFASRLVPQVVPLIKSAGGN